MPTFIHEQENVGGAWMTSFKPNIIKDKKMNVHTFLMFVISQNQQKANLPYYHLMK